MARRTIPTAITAAKHIGPALLTVYRTVSCVVRADTPGALVSLRFTALVVGPYNGITYPHCVCRAGGVEPRPYEWLPYPLRLLCGGAHGPRPMKEYDRTSWGAMILLRHSKFRCGICTRCAIRPATTYVFAERGTALKTACFICRWQRRAAFPAKEKTGLTSGFFLQGCRNKKRK